MEVQFCILFPKLTWVMILLQPLLLSSAGHHILDLMRSKILAPGKAPGTSSGALVNAPPLPLTFCYMGFGNSWCRMIGKVKKSLIIVSDHSAISNPLLILFSLSLSPSPVSGEENR